MIKSRERKNSRNQKQEQETTNQPQISKQKHNCLLFCWPSPLLLLSIWFKGEGRGRLLLGDFGKWAKSCETFLPQWQTTLTPTKKFTNRKVLLFCNFQADNEACTRQLWARRDQRERGRKVAGIEPCRSEPAVC